MSSSTSHTFAAATAITQASSHTYTANFFDEWCIGAVPHGGITTSLIHRALTLHTRTTLSSLTHPDLLTLHLSFIRRTSRGPCTISLRDTKTGRQTSVIHISLSQNGREEVVGYAIMTNFDREEGVSFNTSWTLDPPVQRADLKKLEDVVRRWERKAEGEQDVGEEVEGWRHEPLPPFPGFRKAALRIHSFYPLSTGDPSYADEWIRLRSGEDWTAEALGFVADIWPQLVEQFLLAQSTSSSASSSTPPSKEEIAQRKSAASKFWYPTLLLNLEVKKRVPKGTKWLFARVRAKQIKNGRYDLEVVILDGAGEVVALSQHVAMAVGAGRNLAGRGGEGKGKL